MPVTPVLCCAGTSIAWGRRLAVDMEVRDTFWDVMPIRFDHTIIPAADKQLSARFLTDLLGLPEAVPGGYFLTVTLDDGTTLQYAEPGVEFPGQHFAFLVSEEDFDAALLRLLDAGVEYAADPQWSRPGEFNTNHGGRGLYFNDPSGHHFEILTQPYGSAG